MELKGSFVRFPRLPSTAHGPAAYTADPPRPALWRPEAQTQGSQDGLMLRARPLQAIRTSVPRVPCPRLRFLGRTRPTRVTALDHRRLSPGPPHLGHTQTLATRTQPVSLGAQFSP